MPLRYPLAVALEPHDPSREPARVQSAPARRSAAPERATSFGLDLATRRALCQREPRALEQLFEAFFEPVHGFVQRMVRDVHAAEDLTQEIFLKVHRALERYEPARPLRPWIFTIASNTLRDHFQSARVRRPASEIDESDESALPPEHDPRHSAERAETARAVAAAIERLPESLRSVLVLRHYQQLPFEEIGAALELTDVAARQRFVRALRSLRKTLVPHGPSDGGSP